MNLLLLQTSTSLNKAQIPSVTIPNLIELYIDELNKQRVSNISYQNDTIHFSNNFSKLLSDKFSNKFAFDSFSKGEIKIVDVGEEFVIYFNGDFSKQFLVLTLAAIATTLFILLIDGFKSNAFIIPVIIFALMAIVGYNSIILSFTNYFINLRNRKLKELLFRR